MSSKDYSRPVTHEEYIQMKYLGGTEEQKEKKKRKKAVVKAAKKVNNIRVVDDDVGLKCINPDADDDDEKFAPKEEKPIIAGIVDDRPNELKRKDIDWNRWRTLEPSETMITQRPKIGTSEASRTTTITVDTFQEPERKRMDSDSDLSPPRRPMAKRKDSDDDLSPPRERIKSKNPDGDLSPPRHRHHKRHRSDRRRDRSDRRRSRSRDRN